MGYIILFLSFIVFIYKILFWLYVFQLKEYRCDRFKEYSLTKQGKKAFFGGGFILEMPLLIISFIAIYQKIVGNILIKSISEQLYLPFLILLILEILYLLYKVKKKNILIPVFTGRAKLLLILSIFLFGFLGALIFFYFDFLTTTFLLFSIILPYLYIFLGNFIILPIVNKKKNKILNDAIEKSKKINDLKKVAITGSYGKSSIKEFLSQILESKYKVLKTPENINTEMGVSELISKKLDNKYDFFVAEMGAYRIGEIEMLGNIVNHKDAFLTAIGNQHLGLFGSRNNIIQAKTEIIQKVIQNSGILYANFDNENIKNIPFGDYINIVKYGIENKNVDAISRIIKQDINSTIFEFNYKNYKYTFESKLLGEHNVLNLTGVIAFCLDNGMSLEEIEKGIINIKLPEDSYLLKDIKIENKNGEFAIKIISSIRNLSIASLRTGVNVLEKIEGKKILVLEDILELGKEAKEIHYNIGREIGKKQISSIHFVGANYSNSFLEGLMDSYFEGNFSVEGISKNNIDEKSIIMFLGKKTEKYLKGFLD